MSGEHRRTSLCLTRINASPADAYASVRRYLLDFRRIENEPEAWFELTVSAQTREIVSRRRVVAPAEATDCRVAPDQECWIGGSMNLRVGKLKCTTTLCLNTDPSGRTAIQLQFVSYMYESLYDFDSDEANVNEGAKNDLLRLCSRLAGVAASDGFGLRSVSEGAIAPVPSVDELAAWVSQDLERRTATAWIVAGVRGTRDPVTKPLIYEVDGYRVYELILPSPLKD